MERIQIEQHGAWGAVWIAGWLFTIGYLELSLVQSLFALIIWPYYIGASM